jgi:hypothetical protein
MVHLLRVTKGDGIMTFIKEMQPLIDWCTQPHPQVRPRLKRVASASLTLSEYTSEFGSDPVGEWVGPLVYWPPRGRHKLGGFSGAIPCTWSIGVAVGQHAHVWLTLAEEDPWIGIQGPGFGDEWREDVFLSGSFVGGEKPEDIFVWMYFLSNDDLTVDSHTVTLALKPSYLYGG